MASSQSSNKLLSNLKITFHDFDPDGTSATDVAWVDMNEFENFAFAFVRTVGTGDVTVKILANAQSNGGGTDVEVKTWTNASFGDPDAAFDYAFGECTAAEIAKCAADAGVANPRYVSVNITCGTGTDEALIAYIRGNPRNAEDGLCSNSIA